MEDPLAFGVDTKVLVGEVANKTGESFDIEAMQRDAMVDELEKKKLLGQQGAPDLVAMNVNIIEYRKGDAFKRWLLPGYGSTVLVVEATLLDAEGNVDATAQKAVRPTFLPVVARNGLSRQSLRRVMVQRRTGSEMRLPWTVILP